MFKEYKYKAFCERIFRHFYTIINDYIFLQCNINTDYDSEIFGSFTAPDTINIFIKRFIKEYGEDDNAIRSEIILCIIHELFHSIQIIDHNRYHNDYEYSIEIENAANYVAAIYVKNNKQEIESRFKVNLDHMNDYLDRCSIKRVEFFTFHQDREGYIVRLLSLLLKEPISEITNKLAPYANVILNINNSPISIKNNNVYTPNLNILVLLLHDNAFKYRSYDLMSSTREIYANTICIDANVTSNEEK